MLCSVRQPALFRSLYQLKCMGRMHGNKRTLYCKDMFWSCTTVSDTRARAQIIISFRGTEQTVRDWVLDLRIALNSITQDDATGALRTVGTSGQRDSGWRSWLGPISPLTRPSIHNGFYVGYRCAPTRVSTTGLRL